MPPVTATCTLDLTQTAASHPVTPEREREVRDALGLDGFAFEDEVAHVLRCSGRTIQRLGIPFLVVGNRRLYLLQAARELLRRLGPIGAPDQGAEGLPPAVSYRLRLDREREASDPPT